MNFHITKIESNYLFHTLQIQRLNNIEEAKKRIDVALDNWIHEDIMVFASREELMRDVKLAYLIYAEAVRDYDC